MDKKKVQLLILIPLALAVSLLILQVELKVFIFLIVGLLFYLMFFRPFIYFFFVIIVFNNIPYWLQYKTRISLGSFPVTIPEVLLGGMFISG